MFQRKGSSRKRYGRIRRLLTLEPGMVFGREHATAVRSLVREIRELKKLVRIVNAIDEEGGVT